MIAHAQGIYSFYVYMITNKNNTVLYTGVTNNLKGRLREHEDKRNPKSFSAKYRVSFLVYYEHFECIQQVIAREKEIKNLSRAKKEILIKQQNPSWNFLNYLFE